VRGTQFATHHINNGDWLDRTGRDDREPNDDALRVGTGWSAGADGSPEPLHYCLPTDVFDTHTLVCGGTGAGKSSLLGQIATGILEQDRLAKWLTIDHGFEMLRRFYRPGDVILNPYDERFIGFDLLKDVRKIWDPLLIALAVIPSASGESKPWHEYAQATAAAAIRACKRKGGKYDGTYAWAHMLTCTTNAQLLKFLEGEPIAVLLQNERTSASVRGIIGKYIEPWLQIRPGTFSLREWVGNNADRRSLYITYSEDQLPSVMPLISAWISLAVTYHLSLPPSKSHPIWYFLDEAASVGRQDALLHGVAKLRKRQGRVLYAFQDDSQLIAAYGEDDARTMVSQLSTKIILRPGTVSTAEMLSKEIGTRQVWDQTFSDSLGVGNGTTMNDGTALQKREEPLVMPSELTGLPNFRGYIKVAGRNEIGRLAVPALPPLECDATEAYIESNKATSFELNLQGDPT
jgi:hypothetical protein